MSVEEIREAKDELIKILDHQEKYYPVLKENRDKIRNMKKKK